MFFLFLDFFTYKDNYFYNYLFFYQLFFYQFVFNFFFENFHLYGFFLYSLFNYLFFCLYELDCLMYLTIRYKFYVPGIVNVFVCYPIYQRSTYAKSIRGQRLLPLFLVHPGKGNMLLRASMVNGVNGGRVQIVISSINGFKRALSYGVVFHSRIGSIVRLLVIIMMVRQIMTTTLRLICLEDFRTRGGSIITTCNIVGFGIYAIRYTRNCNTIRRGLRVTHATHLYTNGEGLLQGINNQRGLFNRYCIVVLGMGGLRSTICIKIIICRFTRDVCGTSCFLHRVMTYNYLYTRSMDIQDVIGTQIHLSR